MRHELNEPCPINGGPPVDYIWSAHNREGHFNACGQCGDLQTLPKTLEELNEERGEEEL